MEKNETTEKIGPSRDRQTEGFSLYRQIRSDPMYMILRRLSPILHPWRGTTDGIMPSASSRPDPSSTVIITLSGGRSAAI